jgi:hypothetical protein
MPQDFDKCVREGGKVVTITPKAGRYMHVCYDKSGKAHSGEMRHSAKKSSEAMEELLQLRRQEEQKEREAIDAEIKEKQDNFKNRVNFASHDSALDIEAKDES